MIFFLIAYATFLIFIHLEYWSESNIFNLYLNTHMKKLIFIASFLSLLACSEDKSYYQKPYYYSIGTLQVDSASRQIEYLVSDKGNTIAPKKDITTSIGNNSRVYAEMVNLDESREPKMADFIYLKKILTKSIIPISSTTEDSIGMDPLVINSVWCAQGYITFDISFKGGGWSHMINLVSEDEALFGQLMVSSSSEKPIQLSLRHNAYDDPYMYAQRALVCFDMSSIAIDLEESHTFVFSYKNYRGEQVERSYTYTPGAKYAETVTGTTYTELE